jgi:hypothetical protein
MIEPNIRFAKFLFLLLIMSLFVTPFGAYLSYINMSAKCNPIKGKINPPPSKKSIYITIAAIAILSGLAAQMMNYSYTFMRLKPT